MTSAIETYLNSLSEDTVIINIESKGITSLPDLTRFRNLEELYCYNNPISEIVHNHSLIQIKQNIRILNNVCHLCYCLQFKKQFRKWLWEKVRKPNVERLYNPIYLIENLGDEDDLDTVLNNW